LELAEGAELCPSPPKEKCMTGTERSDVYGANKLPDVPRLDSNRIQRDDENMRPLWGGFDPLGEETRHASGTADA
jgi:hypothetical protein